MVNKAYELDDEGHPWQRREVGIMSNTSGREIREGAITEGFIVGVCVTLFVLWLFDALAYQVVIPIG